MTFIESKKYEFERMIGNFYYKGGLGYLDIYLIALIYFKIEINHSEISYSEISELVHKEINSLIDLD